MVAVLYESLRRKLGDDVSKWNIIEMNEPLSKTLPNEIYKEWIGRKDKNPKWLRKKLGYRSALKNIFKKYPYDENLWSLVCWHWPFRCTWSWHLDYRWCRSKFLNYHRLENKTGWNFSLFWLGTLMYRTNIPFYKDWDIRHD